MKTEQHMFWSCSQKKKGYSGVACISKTKPLSVERCLGSEEHDMEGRSLVIEFETVILVCTYVPNSGMKLEKLEYRTKSWDPFLQQFLNDLWKKSGKPVIWCGDLNVAPEEIDIHNSKANKKSAGHTPEERASFKDFLSQGWVDVFRALNPTKRQFSFYSPRSGGPANGKGWRLDFFVINKDSLAMCHDCCIRTSVPGSDHFPITLKLLL
eukprot:Filipodium_phascolosomae@DN4509_c0_g1_i1.p1